LCERHPPSSEDVTRIGVGRSVLGLYHRGVGKDLPRQELEAAYCWEASDRVPGRPQMTEFRRRVRYHQSQWREAQGHPIGSQPIVPKPGGPVRSVGSRLPLDYARESGANFLTAGALDAANARTSAKEPHQTFDRQRLWADLLWSPTMAFNLFGDLAADLELADRAVHTWWPDAPGTVSDVLFEHSPGRLDGAYIGSLVSFDAAFVLDLGEGAQGVVALDVRYQDRAKPETPKPRNLRRYLQVADRSRAFKKGATEPLEGRSDLAEMWLEHLLLLSMLQHASGRWSWGRYVVLHAGGNTDYEEASDRYRSLLSHRSTYSCLTVEELLAADALPARTVKALRTRYLPR
jgi:hypothetical protein